MKCQYCNTTDNLIYSGTDAFMLGVETEKTCYKCANEMQKGAVGVETQEGAVNK